MELNNDLLEFLDTEEEKKSILEWADKINNKAAILNKQLERFHKKFEYRFKELVNLVILKYDSESYRNRWYKRSIEPTESLFWFLFHYSEKYGREATLEEYKDYGNMFTSEMFYINGFFFNQMNGQGSIIQIYEK